MAMRLMVTSESVVSKRHETRRQTDQQPQEQQHSEHEQPQREAAAASRSTLSAEALTAASALPSAWSATEDTVLKVIANVHVDTDTRFESFVLLFTGDCACCFHPRLPIFCAVLQHVRHETMVGVGPGKRQGVCVIIIIIAPLSSSSWKWLADNVELRCCTSALRNVYE